MKITRKDFLMTSSAFAAAVGIDPSSLAAATDGESRAFYAVNISDAETRTFRPEVRGAKGTFDVRILDATHPALAPNGTWSTGADLVLPPQTLLFLKFVGKTSTATK